MISCIKTQVWSIWNTEKFHKTFTKSFLISIILIFNSGPDYRTGTRGPCPGHRISKRYESFPLCPLNFLKNFCTNVFNLEKLCTFFQAKSLPCVNQPTIRYYITYSASCPAWKCRNSMPACITSKASKVWHHFIHWSRSNQTTPISWQNFRPMISSIP